MLPKTFLKSLRLTPLTSPLSKPNLSSGWVTILRGLSSLLSPKQPQKETENIHKTGGNSTRNTSKLSKDRRFPWTCMNIFPNTPNPYKVNQKTVQKQLTCMPVFHTSLPHQGGKVLLYSYTAPATYSVCARLFGCLRLYMCTCICVCMFAVQTGSPVIRSTKHQSVFCILPHLFLYTFQLTQEQKNLQKHKSKTHKDALDRHALHTPKVCIGCMTLSFRRPLKPLKQNPRHHTKTTERVLSRIVLMYSSWAEADKTIG